jgi:hypothetical protein
MLNWVLLIFNLNSNVDFPLDSWWSSDVFLKINRRAFRVLSLNGDSNLHLLISAALISQTRCGDEFALVHRGLSLVNRGNKDEGI